jgi:hypothetical protein
MANSKLKVVAVNGAATGRACRTAHKVAKASVFSKKELAAISGQVKALKLQLLKNTEGTQPPCINVTLDSHGSTAII